jgi:hypothetical protein
MQDQVAEHAPGPRHVFLYAEIVPLGGQPKVLQRGDILGVIVADHAELDAAEAVDHLLALEVGLDVCELVDQAAFSNESGVLGMCVNRLGPAEVYGEWKIDMVVRQRQAMRGVDGRVLEAPQMDIYRVAGNNGPSAFAVISREFLSNRFGGEHSLVCLLPEENAIPLEHDVARLHRNQIRGKFRGWSIALAGRNFDDILDVAVFRLLGAYGRDDSGHSVFLGHSPGSIHPQTHLDQK